jgi:hypothetical protein
MCRCRRWEFFIIVYRKVISSSSLFLLEEGPGHRSRTLKVRKWICDVFFFIRIVDVKYVNKSPSVVVNRGSCSKVWQVDHGGDHPLP